jgi:hypothetical protein
MEQIYTMTILALIHVISGIRSVNLETDVDLKSVGQAALGDTKKYLFHYDIIHYTSYE